MNELEPAPVVPEAVAPPPRERTCKITDYLSPAVLAMIQKAPENVVYRTHVLAQTRKGVPEEAQTFEQIKDWIEFNLPKPTPEILQAVAGMRRAEQIAAAEAARRNEAFAIRVHYSYIENGRCNYHTGYGGSTNFAVTPEMIRSEVQAARDDGRPWSSVFEAIKDEIREEVSSNPPSTDQDDDGEQTDSHCSDEETNHCTELNDTDLNNGLRRWMVDHMPDVLTELDDNA